MAHPTTLYVDRRWSGEKLPTDARARVDVSRTVDGLAVQIDAPFHEDPAPPSPPGWTEGLWNHEVVELFIAGADGYLELEVGPFGHHLALFFERVRERTDRHLALPPFLVARAGERWQTQIVLPFDWLPAAPDRACAFAVHGAGAARVYETSHPLPGAQPDFHQPHVFPRVELAHGP